MDSRGQIYLDPTEDEKKKKKMIELPKEDAEQVINMNRAARRKYYREKANRERKEAKR